MIKKLQFSLASAAAAITSYYVYERYRKVNFNIIHLDSQTDSRQLLWWKPSPRQEMLQKMQQSRKGENEYDLVIIGGGATGVGTALDAASRGLKVALVEREDFSSGIMATYESTSGTSSKSTKLVHGGVRYLEKAVWNLDYEQYQLVQEALAERHSVLRIAPYLATQLPIMCPIYK